MNAQDLLTALGRTSLQAGVLVLVILAVQWVFQRQLTARWRAALWLLVVARLVLPFSPESALSIFNLLPKWNRSKAAAPMGDHATGDTTAFPGTGQPERLASTVTATDLIPVEPVLGPRPPFVDPLPLSATAAVPPSAVPSRSLELARISGWTWAFWTWLLGIAVLSAHVLRGFLRLQR